MSFKGHIKHSKSIPRALEAIGHLKGTQALEALYLADSFMQRSFT